MKVERCFSLFLLVLLWGSTPISFAQGPANNTFDSDAKFVPPSVVDSTMSPEPTPVQLPKAHFFKNVGRDQKAIFLSPFRLTKTDLKWLLPLTASTTALLITDPKTSSWVSQNGTLSAASHRTGYGGNVVASSSFAAGLFFIGGASNDPHLQKTGKLAFEALLDTSLVIGVLKNTLSRAQPNRYSGSGRFFTKNGYSFPSGHSSDAWAIATVIASEYKNRPLIRYGAIAAAVAISLSRYTGRAHFLSEVVVGSAIGFGTGRFVYMSHH